MREGTFVSESVVAERKKKRREEVGKNMYQVVVGYGAAR